MGMPSAIANYNKLNYYDVSPKIVRTGETTKITIKTKYVTKYPQFKLENKFFVLISPVLDFHIDAKGYGDHHPLLVEACDGELSIDYFFESEQDYLLSVWRQDENGENRYVILRTFLYALDADLYGLIPLKGNTHLHSCYSDGLEEPLQHIGAAFKHGYDYIALTDHNNYGGSMVAQSFLEKLDFSKASRMLTILNGEEFSCNYQPMHIISLGADQPMPKELYIKDEIPKFENEEEQYEWIIQQLNILCDTIHQHNGLVVLCHPYWKPIYDWVRLDSPHKLIKEFIRTGKIDAFEVVGGSPKNQNYVAQLQHLLALESLSLTNKKYAFLGQSDSHVVNEEDESCIFGYHYTVAFCRENSREAILEAIEKDLTVAVEETDGKCEYYGSLRLSNFCRFLEREYFPKRKIVKNMYHQAFELCATGAHEDGQKLFETLDGIKLFEYRDLKSNT